MNKKRCMEIETILDKHIEGICNRELWDEENAEKYRNLTEEEKTERVKYRKKHNRSYGLYFPSEEERQNFREMSKEEQDSLLHKNMKIFLGKII